MFYVLFKDSSLKMMCKEIWNICRGTSGNRIYNRKKSSVIETQSLGPEVAPKVLNRRLGSRYRDESLIPEYEDSMQTQIF
jgi:hypothetical protein